MSKLSCGRNVLPFLMLTFGALRMSAVAEAPTIAGAIDPSPGQDGEYMEPIAYDGTNGLIFGVGGGDNGAKAVVLDEATRRVKATFNPPTIYDVDLAFDSEHGLVYVSDFGGDQNNPIPSRVFALNPGDFSVVRTYEVAGGPTHIAVDPVVQKAYLLCAGNREVRQLDLVTGAHNAVFSISTDLGYITANPGKGKIYFWENNIFSNPAGVIILNSSTGALSGSVRMDTLQFRMAVVGANGDRVYVIGTGTSSGQIYTIDGTSNAQIGQPINLGTQLYSGHFDAASNTLFLVGKFHDEQANTEMSALWKLDAATGVATIVQTWFGDYGIYGHRFTYVPSTQVVHTRLSQSLPPRIGVIKVTNGDTTAYDTGYRPHSVAVDKSNGNVFIRDAVSSELLRANGTTREITARISVGGRGTFNSTLAVNSSTHRVYTNSSSYADGTTQTELAVVDGLSAALLAKVPLDIWVGSSSPKDLLVAVDEAAKRAYVAFEDKLHVIDENNGSPTEHQIVATLTTLGFPKAIAFNPVSKKLYVAHNISGTPDLEIFDTNTILSANPTRTAINGGFDFPEAIAINPVTNRVYITDSNSVTVSVFNGQTNEKITSIYVDTVQNSYGDGIYGVAVDPVTNKIYVSDNAHDPRLGGTLSVINGATNTVSTLGLEIGAMPYHVAVDPVTHRIYVARGGSGTDVVVLDDPAPVAPFTITTEEFPVNGGTIEVANAINGAIVSVVGANGVLTQTLPTGQTLTTGGVVQGNALPGTYEVTVRVRDLLDESLFVDKTYTFTVASPDDRLRVTVQQLAGADFRQGGLISYEWTISNLSATRTTANARFTIEPQFGFVVQGGSNAPKFVDDAGNPIDPPRGAKLPGKGENPRLEIGEDGFQIASFGLGKLKPNSAVKVRATMRIAYDYPLGSVISFDQARASGDRVVDAKMPLQQITVQAAAAGAPRPRVTVAMAQQGADWDASNPTVATVTAVTGAVPGSNPARNSNDIVYRATYTNEGDAPAGFMQLFIPIPEPLRPDPKKLAKNKFVLKARIDGRKAVDPTVNEQGAIFTVPGLEPGASKTVSFVVRVNKGTSVGTSIIQDGALLVTPELFNPGLTQRPLYAKVLEPAKMEGIASGDVLDFQAPGQFDEFGRPLAAPAEPKQTSATFFFHNGGGMDAKKVTATYQIPPGAKYSASFGYVLDGKVSKPLTKRATVVGSTVTFEIGTVKPGKGGFVRVQMDPDASTRLAAGFDGNPNLSAGLFTARDANGQFVPGPVTNALRAPRGLAAQGVAPGLDLSRNNGRVLHRHTGVAGAPFIVVSAPSQALKGDDVQYQVTWGNTGAEPTQELEMTIPIPAGMQFKRADRAVIYDGATSTESEDPTVVSGPSGDRIAWQSAVLPPHSVRTATLVLKVTADGGSSVRMTKGRLFDTSGAVCYMAAHQLYVLRETLPAAKQKFDLFHSFVGTAAEAALGSTMRPSDKIRQLVGALTRDNLRVTIAGADYMEMSGRKAMMIPLGMGRTFAVGQGSSVVLTGEGPGYGSGNSDNSIVAGPGDRVRFDMGNNSFSTGIQLVDSTILNLINGIINVMTVPGVDNLIGNDGSTLVGNDGASLIGNDSAGLIGLDGATLIGNDGSTVAQGRTVLGRFVIDGKNGPAFQKLLNGEPAGALVALSSPANMVAAGGGNLVATSKGLLLAVGSRGNLIGLLGAGLIGNDGSTLIGLDGSTLIGNDGSTLVGNDGASLSKGQIQKLGQLIGLDGSTIVSRTSVGLVGNDGASIATLAESFSTLSTTGFISDNGLGAVPTNAGN